MRRDLVALSMAAVMLTVCGRSATAQSTSIAEALQKLNATLATIPYVNESDLMSDESGPRYRAARDFIRERQCHSRTANPLVALAQPATLNLRGSLDPGRTPQISDSFELPIRVTALTELPMEYLRNTKLMPNADPVKVTTELRQNYDKLNARVSSLVNSFEISRCPLGGSERRSLPYQEFFIVPTH
jgi:hypothetical protein